MVTRKAPARAPAKKPPARKPAAPKKVASGPKWPADHSAKHAQAARKGWAHRRGAGSQVAKFGGSSTHTEKTHYLKPRKKAAPKKPTTRAAAPAGKPKIVISQQSNGRWIINRLYPSGEVRGDPTTYPTKAAAERAASSQRAAGAGVVRPALFGEEQRKRDTYGRGLFG